MTIDSFTSPYLASLMYIVKESEHALVIDPFECDMEAFIDTEVDVILLTHEHYDHISGANHFREKYPCTIRCSVECAKRLGNPRKNMSAYFDIFTSIPEFESYNSDGVHTEPYTCKADSVFEEQKPLYWMGHELRVLYTPGHTIGSACYLLDGDYLFTGDSLFATVDTMTRFPSGSKKAFASSAAKLLELNKETLVLPGHFESFILSQRIDYLKNTVEEAYE